MGTIKFNTIKLTMTHKINFYNNQKKPFIDRVMQAGHYKTLIESSSYNIKWMFTCSRNLMLKRAKAFRSSHPINSRTPSLETLIYKSTCLIDYFHRLSPNNDAMWLNTNNFKVLLGKQYYKYIIDFMIESGFFTIDIRLSNKSFGLPSQSDKNKIYWIIPEHRYFQLNFDETKFYFKPVTYLNNADLYDYYIKGITTLKDSYEKSIKDANVKKLSSIMDESDAELIIDNQNNTLKKILVDISEHQLSRIKNGIEKLDKLNSKPKCVTSVDDNFRIYDSFTNLDKNIRKHTNYRWSLDIGNSHTFHSRLLFREMMSYGHIYRFINHFFAGKKYYGGTSIGNTNDAAMPTDMKFYFKLNDGLSIGEVKSYLNNYSLLDENSPKYFIKELENENNKKIINLWTFLTYPMRHKYQSMLNEIESERSLMNRPNYRKKKYNELKKALSMKKDDFRSFIKTEVFKYILYHNKNYYYENNPIVQIFRDLFPSVLDGYQEMRLEINRYCYRNDLYHYERCNNGRKTIVYDLNLSHLLMKIESAFMLRIQLKLIKGNSKQFTNNLLTIHDALYGFGNSSKAYAKTVMLNEYKKYDLRPLLHEEYNRVFNFSKEPNLNPNVNTKAKYINPNEVDEFFTVQYPKPKAIILPMDSLQMQAQAFGLA